MNYKIDTERTDLFDVSIVIAMLVRINTDVSIEQLKESFDRACRLHEVLNTKIGIDSSGEAYYTDNDDPHNSFANTDRSFYDLIERNECKRFHIEDGEFIRGYNSPEGLVFLMHHLGGDGKSLLYFIESFMRCLNGEQCEYVPFRSLTLDNLPDSSRLPAAYDWLAKHWNRKWGADRKVFDFNDMDAAYSGFWDKHKSRTEVKHYSRTELESILSRSKQAGVTMTACLITDMIKDMECKADVGLAVDGRPDKNRSMGNQATGISVEYKYNRKLPFEDNARKVHSLMKKKLDDLKRRYFVLQFMGRLDPTLIDALNLEHAGYFTSRMSSKTAELMGYGSKVKDISITNLTRADIPLEYGKYRIEDIIFVPPVVSYGKTVIGVITTGDIMNITTHTIERRV